MWVITEGLVQKDDEKVTEKEMLYLSLYKELVLRFQFFFFSLNWFIIL